MNSNEIKEVIQKYFDSGYECSGEKTREIFHSAAHVFGHAECGGLRDSDLESFVKLVETPKQEYPRQDEILSIDFTGENSAVARVKIRVGNIMFTDILCFLRFDGRWKIISKVYSGVPVN